MEADFSCIVKAMRLLAGSIGESILWSFFFNLSMAINGWIHFEGYFCVSVPDVLT